MKRAWKAALSTFDQELCEELERWSLSDGQHEYETDESFRRDVVEALTSDHRRISSKHLYDARGASLFEEICDLPEYYPTRTEMRILKAYLPEIAEVLGAGVRILEYGSGASVKTRLLLDHLESPTVYHPMDISRQQLVETALQLGRDYPELDVEPLHSDFNAQVEISSATRDDAPLVAFFPGSTLGNLDPDDAENLLRRTRSLVGDRGGFLLGLDLVKEVSVMEEAYADAAGVTAAFNLNLLDRMVAELGAVLDRGAFRFESGWSDERSAIESRVVATRSTAIELDGRVHPFAAGDFIHTENSRKFDLDGFLADATALGFPKSKVWTDDAGWFAVILLQAS